jgi:hypothetical protein
MSTPAPPRASSPPGPSLSPTRQQLDELEALMRRMLELPVNGLEEDRAAPVPAVEPEAPPRIETDLDRILAEFPARSWPMHREAAAPETAPELILPRPPAAEIAREREPEMMPPPVTALDLNLDGEGRDALTSDVPAHEPDVPSAAEEAPPLPPEPDPASAVASPPATESAWHDPPPVRRPEPIIVPSIPTAVAPPAAIPDEPPVLALFRPLVWVNDTFDRCTYLLGPAGRWLSGRHGRALLGLLGLLLLAAATAWGVLDWMGWTW